jgi:uncharacterized protein
MKLHLSAAPGLNLIAAYGEDFVRVAEARYQGSLIILPDALLPGHLAVLLDLRPELILLGTGARHRFPNPALLAGLIGAGIGLEAMATGAACRTYNILAAEGRRVAAALIIERN